MKRYALFLLPLWLNATSLTTLIQNAEATHLSLDAIVQRVSAFDVSYAASRNFADPELSLSISDIQFDDPTNRSIEPMQYSAITLKQKIPYTNPH
ncbi:MAG TPA: hypothetical protein CFH84_01130 [Sulfurimonas sp. UBA12504]|nr:MAG: hypothetical protein A2019_02715 [Sulfurimonas sp. GWF2_37_8]DAB30971.1 MAG TPA: hypothetical protein CFH84_01130 [Sulfurimonas sp. UBA12504]